MTLAVASLAKICGPSNVIFYAWLYHDMRKQITSM